ncbi:hypothetical protein AOL_s00140g78 [Orbilia oligospora ATCC 24927]|uniref:Uncharacterized protein n=1 Tax=Arthrobotrys oligospora (strain ATCC 24927 / CBS 115.81 / DSM 1491) TaxID=756982 RepID=G1XMA9_ARTOA|nr:hypothetical protein AOL_s00140g78 [Orbilia oligospora ATCC 24927]EGX45762.1 hypothetical protein AOL_s00140g78 [Orbilia oligospora ATCC 24927]
MMSTMNGEDAWLQYNKYIPARIRQRSCRLNIRLPKNRQEPALDAVNEIDAMESRAREYDEFHSLIPDRELVFPPFSGLTLEASLLEQLADRLRASLFYLQVKSIYRREETYFIKGYICCRIDPGEKGFTELLAQTSEFRVKERPVSIEKILCEPGSPPMSLPVEFSHQSPTDLIRIDVDFGKPYKTTISGFPIRLKVRPSLLASLNC